MNQSPLPIIIFYGLAFYSDLVFTVTLLLLASFSFAGVTDQGMG